MHAYALATGDRLADSNSPLERVHGGQVAAGDEIACDYRDVGQIFLSSEAAPQQDILASMYTSSSYK